MNLHVSPSVHQPIATANIGGVEVGCLTRREWAELIAAQCAVPRSPLRRPAYFTSLNGNVLSRRARDLKLRMAFDLADGVDADGMPIVLASRWLGGKPIPERCSTTDFLHDMAIIAAERGLSMYFLGGTESVSRRAVERLRQMYPALRIAGRRNGYFKQQEEADLIAEINACAPDVLWVGLGVPVEQLFVARHLDKLTSVGAVKTCGGMLDFTCGDKARAPRVLQDAALEWAYRTWLEPRRLFVRYATTNVHALWLILTRSNKAAG